MILKLSSDFIEEAVCENCVHFCAYHKACNFKDHVSVNESSTCGCWTNKNYFKHGEKKNG